jgi:prophage antirepressor-like protein
MGNQLTTFDFNNNNSIRVIDIEGEPWFQASQVCAILGLSNTTVAVQRLDNTERTKLNLGLVGLATANCISESGLYKLIMRSDKPEARDFQDWVTKVVLPSIRKDGGYIMGEEKLATGEMSEDEFLLRAHEILAGKVSRLQQENIDLAEEKASIADQVVDVSRTLAKQCRMIEGINTTSVKSDLERYGYLHMRSGTYRVYSKHLKYFGERINQQYGTASIIPTAAGVELLHKLKREGKLTMKKGFSRN